jgi:hypothetical protein
VNNIGLHGVFCQWSEHLKGISIFVFVGFSMRKQWRENNERHNKNNDGGYGFIERI